MRPVAGRRLLLAAALTAAAGLLLWLVWPAQATRSILPGATLVEAVDEPVAPDAADPASGASAATDLRGMRLHADTDWAAFLATSSLRGAEIDGDVKIDSAGRLVPDLGLRRLFDQLSSLHGEIDAASIRRLLAQLVTQRHGAVVANDVLAIYDRYVSYLAAVDDARLGTVADLRERHDTVRALRRERLGEALADAFFAAEEALAEHTLARIDLVRDHTLDPETRATRLAALDAAAPPAIRDARRDAGLADLLAVQQRQFERFAIDDDTRAAERAALFGPQAAARLAAVDAAESAWHQRLSDYARAAATVRADPRLDASARVAAIEAEQARRFDDTERRRVRSLEAAGLLPDPDD